MLAGMLLCCPVGAAWAGASVGDVPGSYSIPVTGAASRVNLYYEIVLGDADASAVTLPDGVTLSGTSTSSSDAGLHVVIVPVTYADEPDARAWVAGALEDELPDQADSCDVYYLAFYRDDMRVYPVGDVTIALAAEPGFGQDATVRYLGADGRASLIASQEGDGALAFGMSSEGYYVIAADQEPVDPDDPGGGVPGEGPGSDAEHPASSDAGTSAADAATSGDAAAQPFAVLMRLPTLSQTGDVVGAVAAGALLVCLAMTAVVLAARRKLRAHR